MDLPYSHAGRLFWVWFFLHEAHLICFWKSLQHIPGKLFLHRVLLVLFGCLSCAWVDGALLHFLEQSKLHWEKNRVEERLGRVVTKYFVCHRRSSSASESASACRARLPTPACFRRFISASSVALNCAKFASWNTSSPGLVRRKNLTSPVFHENNGIPCSKMQISRNF